MHCLSNQYDAKNNYIPSRVEEIVNFATHGVPAAVFLFIVCSAITEYGLEWLLVSSVSAGGVSYGESEFDFAWLRMVTSIVYGGTLFLVLTCSALYHLGAGLFGRGSMFTRFFMLMDHAIIFVFIAASYTPWLLLVELGEDNWIGKAMLVVVWLVALMGLIRCTTCWLDRLVNELNLYLIMGWMALVMLYPMIQADISTLAFLEILAGGLFFSAGILFYATLDGKLPFSHALWHMMVTCGIAVHYHAVYTYLWNAKSTIKRLAITVNSNA